MGRTRRKALAVRNSKGRIAKPPPQIPPPSEVRRLRDLALAGTRPAEYGTQFGRLYLEGKLTGTQFAAARRWARLRADYAIAMGAPRPPCTAPLDPTGGTPPDPDSEPGQRQGRWCELVTETYEEAEGALKRTSEAARAAVVAICELDRAPIGYSQLEWLKIGLSTLVVLWTEPVRKKASV